MLATVKMHWRSVVGVTCLVIGAISIPAIATAPLPPQLVLSKLNGKPINILYVTRSSDRVLVRCYPGLKPIIAVRQMTGGTKEGVLTCVN
jgi:hypothetical protein